MIIIDDAGDGLHLTVQIVQHRSWPQVLNLIRGLSNRYYEKGDRKWRIPYNVLPDLQKDTNGLSHLLKDPSINISMSAQARANYNYWLTQIEKRTALQTAPAQDLKLNGHFLAEKFPEYQRIGAYFLYASQRAICGDPTGSGKSVIALAATALGFTKNRYQKVIIVCESSLREKWKREVEKFVPWPAIIADKGPKARQQAYKEFGRPQDPSYLIVGLPTLRQGIVKQKGKAPLMTNSETVFIHDQLEDKPFAMIIDEIQNCKHTSSLQSYGVRHLSDRAQHVYGLSATYIEGRLQELHSVFRAFRPEVFGSFWAFSQRHIDDNAWDEKHRYRKVDEVKRKARPFVIRRKDIDDEGVLPKILFIDRKLILSANQKALYRQVLDEEEEKRRKIIALRGFRAPTDSMWKMSRERQICCFPEIADENITESPKFDDLVNIIESLEQEAKVVIFSHFQKVVEILLDRLHKYWRTVGLHGGMKVNREAIRKEFMESDARILVTSDVWQRGQDLDGVLVNYDILFNPAWMQQRAGRVRRFTTVAKQVIVYTQIMEKTVEEYIFDEILEPKRKLMTDFIDDGDEGAAVTRRVIRDIVQNYRG